MSRGDREIEAALARVVELPYGLARTTGVEQLVGEADAIDDERLGVRARAELLSCYSYGGEPLKRFAPFAWMLRRMDTMPSWWTDWETRQVLWMFKWVTVGVLEHPAVPLAQINQAVEDMADRYARTGHADTPVLGVRYQVSAHVHGEAAPETVEAYERWVIAPRTPLCDCAACVPSHRVRHLAALGRHEDAVREAMPVLDHGGCREQPQATISKVLPSLLLTGAAARAAHEHVRGMRLLRADVAPVAEVAPHLLTCARTGRLARGLDLLEEYLTVGLAAPTPWAQMLFAAAGARLLAELAAQGHGELAIASRPGPGSPTTTTVAGLHEQLRMSADAVARQFDARNGTPAVSELVDSILTAGPLPDLPLVTRTTPRSGLHDSPVVASHETPVRLPEDDPTALATELVRSRLTGQAVDQRRVLVAWSQVRRRWLDEERGPSSDESPKHDAVPPAEPVDPEQVAIARLEAALCLEELSTALEAPVTDLRTWEATARNALGRAEAAVAGLYLAGETAEALVHEQLCLLRSTRLPGTDLAAATARIVDLATRTESLADPGATGTAWSLAARLLMLAPLPTETVLSLDTPSPSADPGDTLDEGGDISLLDPAEDSGLDDSFPQVEVALDWAAAAFAKADRACLTPLQLGTYSLLPLQRVDQESASDVAAAAREGLALLPPGSRCRERAVLRWQLGLALAREGELESALAELDEAVENAIVAAEERLTADILTLLGRVHAELDQWSPCAEAHLRAAELLDELEPDPAVAAQSYLEGVHALRSAGRSVEAADLGERVLSVLEEGLDPGVEASWDPPGTGFDDRDPLDDRDLLDDPVLVEDPALLDDPGLPHDPALLDDPDLFHEHDLFHDPDLLTGLDPGSVEMFDADPRDASRMRAAARLAYATALCCRDIGNQDQAHELARRSAAWHRRTGSPVGAAESLTLAAAADPDAARAAKTYQDAARLFDVEGAWQQAAACRRARALRVLQADGPIAADLALQEARAHLLTQEKPEEELPAVQWHLLALNEQEAWVAGAAGDPERALALTATLDEQYRRLGDRAAAREISWLRTKFLEDLGRPLEALPALQQCAEEALADGDLDQARRLGGRLADLLDQDGRPDAAEDAWSRFSGG